MITFTESVSLTRIDCGQCGATYAINERLRSQREREGGGWHCPYCGCSWGYFNNSENARLKKLLDEKGRELVAQKCETLKERNLRQSVEFEKAKADRKLHRVNNGVCPCCKRSFTNLRRHMLTKHAQLTTPAKPG